MVQIKLVFFSTQKDLRKWFEKNHKKERDLLVGYYKISTGKPSVSWSQSVDEAICFGWIGEVRKSVDEESYCIRFTPRNPKSNWSVINIKKAEYLITLGLMKPGGFELFNLRKKEKSGIYSYENTVVELEKSYEKKLKTNKKAWKCFQSTSPSYRKVTTSWVMSAKQETIRLKRLNELITAIASNQKIKAMNYGKKQGLIFI
ncbi:MAG: YdeI/OmpD-associated family protein [Ignavibacteriaceae bacterium]